MKIEKMREELEKARQKATEWQARAKDIERRVTEQENLEIVQAVRSIAASPEELGGILEMIRSMKEPPAQNNIIKEGTYQNEEQV